jgi:hypothetical protein
VTTLVIVAKSAILRVLAPVLYKRANRKQFRASMEVKGKRGPGGGPAQEHAAEEPGIEQLQQRLIAHIMAKQNLSEIERAEYVEIIREETSLAELIELSEEEGLAPHPGFHGGQEEGSTPPRVVVRFGRPTNVSRVSHVLHQ